MYKTYKKNCCYSYVGGFYPCFELAKYHKDKILHVFFSSSAENSEGYKKMCALLDSSLISVDDRTFNRLKEKDNDHCIAVFSKYDSKLSSQSPHVVLYNPSDMGNMGNIMRSMAAFDYKDLAVILPGCDSFNPKVVRSSMGSRFFVNVETFQTYQEYLASYPDRVYYTFMLQAKKGLKDVKKPVGKFSLVFGNEASGLPRELLNENSLIIEQSDKVDSLNLATSVVLALYEFKYLK